MDRENIEPIANTVWLILEEIYKSGAGLKRHVNKCKERGKDLDKHESLVINDPPIENDTADKTIVYT